MGPGFFARLKNFFHTEAPSPEPPSIEDAIAEQTHRAAVDSLRHTHAHSKVIGASLAFQAATNSSSKKDAEKAAAIERAKLIDPVEMDLDAELRK